MGHRSRIKLPRSLLGEEQSGELASLELPDHSSELGRRMSWLWAASSHTQGIVTGELVFVWRRVKKNRTDARTALVTHRWYGPATFCWQREQQRVCLIVVDESCTGMPPTGKRC